MKTNTVALIALTLTGMYYLGQLYGQAVAAVIVATVGRIAR